MRQAVLMCLVLFVVARGRARQLPGHRSREFSDAAQVYTSMELFCNTRNTASSSTTVDTPPTCIQEPLRLGAWNLQRFGIAKMRDANVVAVIVEVIRNYDLVVLQEVTDSSGTSIPALMLKINEGLSDNDQYSVILSPRIGRTSYKEQYVFIFKTARITYIKGYKYQDATDIFQIEPFVAQFQTLDAGPLQDFVVIPLHAKPSAAVTELDALVDVYDDMINRFNITDAILVGDFNAGCNYVVQGEYEQIRLYTQPRFHWLISDHADTTTKTTSCPYDRIIVTGEKFQMAAYYKTAFTYYFDEDLGIEANWNLVGDVSDHYPVGVLIRGTVPESIVSSYKDPSSQSSDTEAAASHGSGIRLSVSVDLPSQSCWAQVMTLIHGIQVPDGSETCNRPSSSGNPQVVVVMANIAMVEWRTSTVDAALATLIQMAKQHPQLVTKEAVAVLGYKAGHGVLSDHTLYLAFSEPQNVRLSLLCQTEDGLPRCTMSLSAVTNIN